MLYKALEGGKKNKYQTFMKTSPLPEDFTYIKLEKFSLTYFLLYFI